jgi:hypothetical protein
MAMYFADPDQGRRRRAMMRDGVLGVFRGMPRVLGRQARSVVAETYGRAQRVLKGRININTEAGIVVLRGELGRSRLARPSRPAAYSSALATSYLGPGYAGASDFT